MKLFFSVAFATFMLAGTLNAQHINIGLKGGLNVYNVDNDKGSSNDPILGYHLGLIGHTHLAPQWALQPELMFSAQGAKYTIAGVETKLKLNYINIPLMIQYMFDNGFRLQAGPQLGILASANSSVNDNDTDIKDSMETVEFGLGGGIGYVDNSSGLGIDLRYNRGISNINKNSSISSNNSGLQIGLFYLFAHK